MHTATIRLVFIVLLWTCVGDILTQIKSRVHHHFQFVERMFPRPGEASRAATVGGWT
jgi:hypothetical protein